MSKILRLKSPSVGRTVSSSRNGKEAVDAEPSGKIFLFLSDPSATTKSKESNVAQKKKKRRLGARKNLGASHESGVVKGKGKEGAESCSVYPLTCW